MPSFVQVKGLIVILGSPNTEQGELYSSNTLEDASLSKPIALKYGARRLVVVTSDYHLDRARYIFEREFADTEINFLFSACRTDEAACQLDLGALKKHEREALARLKRLDPNP
jgi:uncharacterized SAM-binding protein YcdF (DUF218 family)